MNKEEIEQIFQAAASLALTEAARISIAAKKRLKGNPDTFTFRKSYP